METSDSTVSTVSAWGDNSNSQLGDGTTTERYSPGEVKDLRDAVEIEAGSGHVVALLADGTAVAWGRNAFGQIGDGTTTNPSTPVPVQALSRITGIAPGGGHTAFLTADGSVWACGAGFFGCLGPEHRGIAPVPVPIGLDGVRQLVSGGGHCVALREDGTVWTWGRDDFGQLGDGTDPDSKPGRATQEHAGRGYPCRYVPAQVEGLAGVKLVAAGGGHSLAVLADGTVHTWGCNDRGQLGDGTTNHRAWPEPVADLPPVDALGCGYHHTLAVLADGTVRGWGVNDRGQLGDGTVTNRSRPARVLGMRGAVAVVASGGGGDIDPGGRGHSMALLDDGTVWTWGCNDHGELGDGTTTERHTPVQVTSLHGVRRITAGGEVPNFRENPGGGYGLAIH
jgi:alpha-tubulin suppressor-like RCC1 family protein